MLAGGGISGGFSDDLVLAGGGIIDGLCDEAGALPVAPVDVDGMSCRRSSASTWLNATCVLSLKLTVWLVPPYLGPGTKNVIKRETVARNWTIFKTVPLEKITNAVIRASTKGRKT